MLKVQPGRYQTRLTRIVDITGSRMVMVNTHTGPVEQRQWDGTLYAMDGKTPDTVGRWDDLGQFVNPRGVTTPQDLVLLIQAAPEPPAPEKAPEPPAPEKAPEPPPPPPAPDNTQDARIQGELPRLRDILIGTLAKVAHEKEIVVTGEDDKTPLAISDEVMALWQTVIADTLVPWMDQSAKSAAAE